MFPSDQKHAAMISEFFGKETLRSINMVKTSGWQQFSILLFKGFLYRKRHYIVTAFEFLIPILLSIIPIFLLSKPEESNILTDLRSIQHRENATIYPKIDPFSLSEVWISGDVEFVYTPDTPVAGNLIDEAIALWENRSMFDRGTVKKAFATENALVSHALHLQKVSSTVIIGTVFNNFNILNGQLPDSLDYKIRYSSKYDSFYTDRVYRSGGPQLSNVYLTTYFTSWQAAVEESFIQKQLIKRNKLFQYKVMMQRFPYPSHLSGENQLFTISIIPWVQSYGFLIFLTILLTTVVEESCNRSKELLKMMGMTDWVYWSSTFMNYFSVGAIITLVICIIYKTPAYNSATLIPRTDFSLLLIFLLLQLANYILFAFAISVFIPHRIFSRTFLLLAIIVSHSLLAMHYFFSNSDYFLLSKGQKLGICLLPSGAALTLFHLISTMEAIGVGAQWSNISQFDAIPDMNLLSLMGMMVASGLIFIFIIWYIDAVWPWQYGVPKPFYFPFTKGYWFGYSEKLQDAEDDSPDLDNLRFFEEEPTGSTPGVVIKNLSKKFKTGMQTKLAVNNISLNVYNGQITALLGHNGAGKTTTIHILTGLFPPSSGTATIDGWDVLSQTINARRSLGVCPQHNILYESLTPHEHLQFYAGVKGVKWRDLADESLSMLKDLDLDEKKDELVKNLSGGMKRKLSLAIALIGGSKVLFLDEPTSGLDPESRRKVWDALLKIRNDRTIVLTTHYMEEADILGDRIAIMANGSIQCCGSSMFLKKKLGTGYVLRIVKAENFKLEKITEVLQSYVPDATLETEDDNEVTFNLSFVSGSSLGEMFETLESQQEELGYSSHGISVTTMEDVFLNIAKFAELQTKGNEKESEADKNYVILNGMQDMYAQQQQSSSESQMFTLNRLSALLMKRFHYSKRSWMTLIAQIVIPFAVMCLLLWSTRKSPLSEIQASPSLKLNLKNVYGKTNGFYHSSGNQAAKSFADKDFKKVLEENEVSLPVDNPSFNPQEYVIQFGEQDLYAYLKSFIVGGTIQSNDTSLALEAWYNGEPYHAMPLSLNIMHNAILCSITGSASGISLTNDPLPYFITSAVDDSHIGHMVQLFASIMVPLSVAYLSASYVLYAVQEKSSRSKLLQLMTGLPSSLYWGAMLLWDGLFHCVICILLLIPFCAFGGSVFLSHPETIGSVFFLLVLYGWCSIPFCYLLSFLFKKSTSAFQVILIVNILTGVVLSSIMTAVESAYSGFLMHTELPHKIEALMWVFRIFPTFSVSNGVSNVFGLAFSNAFCDDVPEKTLELACNKTDDTPVRMNPLFKCCKDICGSQCANKTSLIGWHYNQCGREILFMALEGILFFLLLLFFETTIPKSFWRSVKRKIKATIGRMRRQPNESIPLNGRSSSVNNDPEALADSPNSLPKYSTFEDNSEEHALKVVDLTKIYKGKHAVDGLTFGVKDKECFGLLGINGAGKTTTFKMLTGDILPSYGNAHIGDISLINNRKKFQSYIGYCPQYDALLDRLTGYEMLILFARLRGLTGQIMENAVDHLVKMVDLKEHAFKQTRLYSGGNKRKLSLALAIIGMPRLMLLDEPTSGVDPASRRKIWNILKEARNSAGSAIILTTHSMEESEALCNRLAIMVNGEFKCLGSLQQLKTKYSKGHLIILKVKKEELLKDDKMEAERSYFDMNFKEAKLLDSHQGMLQYEVTDTSIPLSYLFKFMESMKEKFDLADYLISDTTLEQIFLTFARQQIKSDEVHV